MYTLLSELNEDITTRDDDGPCLNWYHEELRGADTLLITVGDSWTWGDNLGNVDSQQLRDDAVFRTQNIFGAVMSKTLDWDFLMLAYPGCGNVWMHDQLRQSLPAVVSRYRRVVCVVTLTELAREIIYDDLWCQDICQAGDLQGLLAAYEANMLASFHAIELEFPQVNIIVARNFTHSYDSNLQRVRDHLPVIWTEVLAQAQPGQQYPCPVRMISQLALKPLIQFLRRNQLLESFKHELLELCIVSESALDWLDASAFNSKRYTRHPTVEGHKLWAEHLIKHLDKYTHA